MSMTWCGGKEYLGRRLLLQSGLNISERWLGLWNKDLSVGTGSQTFAWSCLPFGVLSTCWRKAGVVLPYGELGNAGRKASGFKEGEGVLCRQVKL